MTCLPSIAAELNRNLANSDLHSGIRYQAGRGLSPDSSELDCAPLEPRVQREIARDFVVCRLCLRHSITSGWSIGPHHFNSARGPVIPMCLDAQLTTPTHSFTGPFNVQLIWAGDLQRLLVRAENALARLSVVGSGPIRATRGLALRGRRKTTTGL